MLSGRAAQFTGTNGPAARDDASWIARASSSLPVLIAEEVAAVDPALIGLNDGKPHVVKTQNVVADLVAVVQHQTGLLERQAQRIDALERQLSTR